MNNDLGRVVRVSDIDSDPSYQFSFELTEVNDRLFFSVSNEIYVTDGTEGGTKLVSNNFSFPYFTAFSPSNFTEFDGKLYFSGNVPFIEGRAIGRELFVTDGTEEGTELVFDINPGIIPRGYALPNSSRPYGFTEFNDKLYFAATGSEAGRELYVTDGTEEGTELVSDINPGISGVVFIREDSSSPDGFTEFNGRLYFAATGDEAGRELYVTDGTTRGTELIEDVNPGRKTAQELAEVSYSNYYINYYSYVSFDRSGVKNDSDPRSLTEFKGKLYFSAVDKEFGRELYVTDGTVGDARRVTDLNPGGGSSFDPMDSSDFVQLGEKLYFVADNGTSGKEIYVTDGTAEGTKLIKDINPDGDSFKIVGGSNFTEFGDKLYFVADDGTSGGELYVTDGTAEGTKLIKDINLGSGSSFEVAGELYLSRPDFTEFNGKLYFRANDGTSGTELFVTDGTAEGTKLVADINPGSGGSFPTNLTVFNNELFFNASDDGILNQPSSRELFKLTMNDTMTQPSNLITESLNPILGTDSNDDLPGTDGNDGITGESGSDVLNGKSGNDVLDGGAGSDSVDGKEGTDTAVYQFAPAAVTVNLGEGTANDGFGGTDFLSNIENAIASEFDDTLVGNSGNNSLTGRDGNDEITGLSGDDFLTGGMGADILTGGEGSDLFVYLNPNEGGDTITDFVAGVDKIAVLASSFGGGLSAGELPESSFAFGSVATDSEQRFVFDPASNELFFDMDGNGAAPQQLIATVGGEAKMSAGDIMLL